MINYPIPISQQINDYYNIIEEIKKLEKKNKILKEKINKIEEEKKKN